MSSIKTTELQGDVSVGRHVDIGGNANVQGNTLIKKNLKVEGWLDAKNIKGANKGVFTTIDSLREAYPNGTLHDGSWAIVGGTLPGELWFVYGGRWVDSGKTAGSVTVDVEQYLEGVQQQVKAEMDKIQALIDAHPVVQQTGDSTTSVMSQKAVTEKFNIISNSIESLNDKDKGKITWSDFSFTKGAIASDGSFLNHRAFDTAYIYLHDMEVVGQLSLHIKACAFDTTAIIGFYSSEEVSKETLLSLVGRKNTQEQFEDYEVLIPNGTKMIAVNYRTTLFTDEEIAKQITASITYTKNGYIRQYVASVCQGMTPDHYIFFVTGVPQFIALNYGYTKVVTDGKGYDSILVYEENIPKNHALVAFYSDIETISKDTYLKKYSLAGTETKGWRKVDIPSEAKLMCIAYAKDQEVKNLPGIILIKDGEKASNVIFENNAEYKDAQSAIEGALLKADEAMEKVVVPVQQRGTSSTEVMSQNAVSHELDLIETSLAGIGKRIDEIKPVTGNVTNNPDNEYITAKDGKLTFADKFFDRSQFSGYGRVYVRKNIKKVRDYTEEEIKLSDKKFYICTKSINGQNVAFESGDNCFTNGQIPSVENGNFRSVALKVTNNDILAIQNTGAGRCRAWMLYDDDGTVLAVADDNINSVNAPYELVVAQHIKGTTANLIINHNLIGNGYRKPYVVKRRYTGATYSANILTGIEYPNTIYHIQYDFDLNGRLLALPKNSILIFEGGSIKNGDIVGNLSEMVSNLTPIYGERLNLYGTWTTSTFYPEWFGAIGDGISDDTAAIQRVLDLGDQVKMRAQICCFLTSKYLITSGLRINGGTTLRGLYKSSFIGQNNPESSILICQFTNTKQWALQSNNYGNFDSSDGTFYEGQLFPYNDLVGRRAYDQEWLKSQTGIRIENICITAKKTGEAYIFGGVRLMVGESSMHDVGIFGFWIGYARSCSWFSTDDGLHVAAKYIACYIGSDMNGFHLRDCYLDCMGSLNEGDVTKDYQFAGTSESKSVSVYGVYARGIVENVISESADYARSYSSVIITEIHPYFEAIKTAVYKVVSSEVTIIKGTIYSGETKLGIINSSTFTWLGEWWHSYGWDITNSSVQFIGGAHSAGDSADRKKYGAYLPSQCVGQTYYDTTLGKVLYWSGNGWKDAIGNSVE